jgi:XRE family aerobic/anaerobic benzoate catabolism transcriptional regulator
MDQLDMASASVAEGDEAGKSPLLQALGERVRNLRARRGLTRRGLASAAVVSERHLANLEYGTGNVSILVLQQIAMHFSAAWPSCWAM